jgi:magnesium chelatase family protein
MIQRYVSKVSGPLLDRIDIHIEVPAVQYKELRGGSAAEGSAEIRARVMAARERQHTRFGQAPSVNGTASGQLRTRPSGRRASQAIYANAQMSTQQVRVFCELSSDAERILERAMQQQGLSARAHDRILKVARTIADLETLRISQSNISPRRFSTGPWTEAIGLEGQGLLEERAVRTGQSQ